MSLAKRNDGKSRAPRRCPPRAPANQGAILPVGCCECRMRRVRCDKTEPECLKCRKKGIACSGQGFECRFSKHMRKRQAGPVAPWAVTAAAPPKDLTWVQQSLQEGTAAATWQLEASSSAPRPGSCAGAPPTTTATDTDTDTDTDTATATATATASATAARAVVPRGSAAGSSGCLRGALQTVPCRSRVFFDHFSNFIASKMVVFDFQGNGYRQILLPLACQNGLVGQAVSVVAAFHLAQKIPSMHAAAERSQELILSRLRQQSLRLDPRTFCSLSTWATILVLLVGDTITGSSNYVYLLQLLSRLAQSAADDASLSDATKAFVAEQTKMFQLFGFPLSSESQGVQTLSTSPDYYLDFMTSHPALASNQENYSNVMIMKDAIRQACSIYRNRASHQATPESSADAVERLRQTAMKLGPDADGSHALVWAFFVAAAESSLPEHRDFFYNRLKGLFQCTRFGSIPLALQTLDYIWARQETANWTEIVTHQRPILIM
ncbi:uncharacterized protein UV8b_06987 [Ustilaginoidea virens]|uniref:Zn(2)-C6 fungal-type domain-containing protein n=1 Tax=Ustilaginoidea virens TaxID=1159556 RepID=A0A8E5MKC9_USTVR|nr:uncharacterized protein UV8b_06987 [Ustilaginoidea virens]QUC22746.1 hypothetical protein UV8b_06987 [Ustilaginoidea virens]